MKLLKYIFATLLLTLAFGANAQYHINLQCLNF